MKPQLVFLIAPMALTLIGCGTLDVASENSGPPPVCEIHQKEMAPEMIQLTSGEIVYVAGFYQEPLEKQFPHHGGWVYQGERPYGVLGPRKVRDFVCSDCTAAFHRFWQTRSK